MSSRQSNYPLIFFIILFLGLFFILILEFATPIVLAIMIAFLTKNWHEKISAKFRNRQNLAGLIIILMVVLIIITPTIIISSMAIREISELYHQIQIYITPAQIDKFLQSNNSTSIFIKNISENLNLNIKTLLMQDVAPTFKNIGFFILNQADSILSNVFNLILGFFMMLLTIFYLLKDRHLIKDFFSKIIPLSAQHQNHLFATFKNTCRAIFYGNFISAASQGLAGGIGFLIFGISSPLLWGIIMTIFSFFPLLGPYLVFIPVSIFLFMSGETILGLGFLAYNLIITSSIDNIIKPVIIGDKTSVHPLLILISILGGLKIFGIMGIIYGPLIIAILLTLTNIYIREKSPNISPMET